MSYKEKTNIAARENYGIKRTKSSIEWIVIHYTGNDGDTDENNGKYFHNNIVKASAHYFVDSDSVTNAVPYNYVAYSVGGVYKTTGGSGKYYKKCTNANSISIELCDDVRNGKIYPSTKTIANAIELTKKLMKTYNIPQSHVIRHYDVNGKSCPAYWCGSTDKDKKWKSEFWNKLKETTSTAKKTTSTNSKYPAVPFLIKVLVSDLNYRSSYSTSSKSNGHLKKGTKYTITKLHGDWGYLKSGAGWVYLGNSKYCEIVKK